ncbi:MAG: DUF1330 domain-containing protein [Deltaproteobacteria bacterium]|nr:DUF1330 domain-containing protein [Deltaproteobacteria bacterium]
MMDINPLATLDEVQPEDLDTGPVVVLNLLKFKPGSSLETYLEYVNGVMAEFSELGIEAVYAGKLEERIQGEIGDWDAVVVVRYPSRRACYEMFRSEKYQEEISPWAEAALERRVLWPSEPVLPYKTQTVDFDGGEWLEMLAAMNS